MKYLNRKWFEVVWSLKSSPLKKYSDEIEADSMTEAEKIVTRLYGIYENDFDDVIIHYSSGGKPTGEPSGLRVDWD